MDQLALEEILSKLKSAIYKDDFNEIISIIEDLHPADQADIVEQLDPDIQLRIITYLHPSDSADVLERMIDEEVVKIAEKIPLEQLADILEEMKSDEATDVVSELRSDKVSLILEEMEDPDEIIDLLKYPSDTAGGLMIVAEVTLTPDLTVSEALSIIRRGDKLGDNTYYLFVTDEDSLLIGVIGLHELIYSPSSLLIQDLMETKVISVAVTSHEEEVTQIIAHYGFLSIPVVDFLGKLVGVITVDDIFELSRNKATKDMYGLAGITGEERLLGPIRESVIKRLPWLAINVLTLFIAISVIDAFEAVIAGTVALAIFLPIVSGEGGNAGSQTSTVIVRSIALNEIQLCDGRKVLFKEIIVSFINGLIIGLATALVVYLWIGIFSISLAIFLAMTGNFLIAALTGVLIPLGLNKLDIDPALSSAAFVTAFTDAFGFLFFLGIVSLII